MPTAKAPYCNRIAWMNSFGRYLIERIATADDIIHWIGPFFLPPNNVFLLMTV